MIDYYCTSFKKKTLQTEFYSKLLNNFNIRKYLHCIHDKMKSFEELFQVYLRILHTRIHVQFTFTCKTKTTYFFSKQIGLQGKDQATM